MKYTSRRGLRCTIRVAPRAGAWIEMTELIVDEFGTRVAPRAGAWIEIRAWFFL